MNCESLKFRDSGDHGKHALTEASWRWHAHIDILAGKRTQGGTVGETNAHGSVHQVHQEHRAEKVLRDPPPREYADGPRADPCRQDGGSQEDVPDQFHATLHVRQWPKNGSQRKGEKVLQRRAVVERLSIHD